MKKYLAFIVALFALFMLSQPVVFASGLRDLHHNIEVKKVISPQSTSDNTAIVGTVIDSAGYGAVEYVILTGAQADNNATFTVLLEDCDEAACNVTNAAVADTSLFGTEAAASWTTDVYANTVFLLGYRGSKRYTRLTITPAANTGANYLSATAILGYPKVAPTR